ncbi:MAG: flagellar hook-associated protein FlgK [Acidimicrobiales bacterium]
MGNFGGLQVAYTGLNAHHKRIDVISENIANVNTEGYHRQRVELRSIDQASVGLFSGRVGAGGGVDYSQVTRLRNQILSTAARDQANNAATRTRQADLLQRIEDIVGGLDPGGLHDKLTALFNSFDDLANAPEDSAIREVVLRQADNVAQAFTRTTAAIDQLRDQEHASLVDTVRAVNALTEQIAADDVALLSAVNSDAQPNSLLDGRDLKVAKLAKLIDADVVELPNGQTSISVDGQLVVSAGKSTPLTVAVENDPALAPLGYDKIKVVGTTGRELRIASGEVGASLDALANGIPEQRRAIDALIADLADQVNTVHRGGQGADGSTGLDLFRVGINTGELTVSTDVNGHPEKLAAARLGAGAFDDGNARALAQLGESTTGPVTVFSNAVGVLAAKVASATSVADAAQVASEQATSLAQSAGGVSLDQELTDLITAQRAYEASARMITAIDEMLQTLIHSTGRVGA